MPDLQGIPTAYILRMIVTRPEDPRYREAVRELHRRGVAPDFVIVEDEVVEKFLCSPEWGDVRPVSRRISFLKSEAAQALAGVSLSEQETSQIVYYRDIYWTFQKVDSEYILTNISKSAGG